MQRLRSPLLFQTLPASARLWECQRRHIRHHKGRQKRRTEGPLRNTYPTFDISSLLLDLDAEGARGVRNFDSQLDGVPREGGVWNERELQPIKERIADFERAYRESDSKFKSLSADRFHPLHISDLDFLAAALFGQPNAPGTAARSRSGASSPVSSYEGMLDSALDMNGIPRSTRINTESTIKYMLRRRAVARDVSPEPGDETSSRLAFDKYRTFSEIDRLVTRMIQTPEGCQLLSSASDELHASLIGLSDMKPIRLLSLLNNVLINLDRHGLHVSTKLYELGIWTALKFQAIATAHRYITRMVARGYHSEEFMKSILNQLSESSIATSHFISYQFQLNPSSRLGMVFSLLTGYVPGEEKSTVSLRSFVNRENPNSFRLYIRCLARLGAFRTIWHEWHAADSKLQGIGADAHRLSAFTENGYLVVAILEALAKNNDMGNLIKSPEFTNVTGNFREDCQLDMSAISKWADTLASPENSIGEYTSTTIFAARREILRRIFEGKQMQSAFPAIQTLFTQITSPR
ncbi:putative methylmalonate-semialdehyde dehydrogenase protein [Rosellinia necatrix]|uniref:Putative methylmalonate-semialdehyde dehydrogenase protein n=1 Tax=Rosellinia necatrix TaxID=77044 RepID=A0A1W2TMX0_ROSNE|nr:putative methylmalonate-semialdehyde dehydrogenase protein [Rosellinia necatrix]